MLPQIVMCAYMNSFLGIGTPQFVRSHHALRSTIKLLWSVMNNVESSDMLDYLAKQS